MDIVLDCTWTVESFLAWEDRREFKYEFDGREPVPMTGGSLAHQRIVVNLWVALMNLLEGSPYQVAQEMRLRTDRRVRYPDAAIFAGPLDRTTRTSTDAIALFEVLSDDTATTDRVEKLLDYAHVPSLRCYILLEQAMAADTIYVRDPAGAWMARVATSGCLDLPGLDIAVPLADLYRALTFPARA